MTSPVILLVAIIAAVTACSPAPTPNRSPSALTPTVESVSPLPSTTSLALGTLVVRQSRIAGGFYIEGAFAYVEVSDESGRPVARVEDPEYHLAKELARVELPVGGYVVGTYVRPCEAACPALDGPTDRCQLTVDVVAGEVVAVHVERSVGRACRASVVGS